MTRLAIIVTVAIGLVVPLAGCSTNTATGRTQFTTLSREQEVEIGEEVMPELIAQYGGEVESRPLRSYVNRIGNRLLQHVEDEYQDLPWQFTLLDSDVINAFALPGGKVFFSMGLLRRCSNEAEVAAVLGHEIGHVTAEHVDERLSRAMLLELGISVAGAGGGLGAAAGALFANGYLLKFGRDQEAEADILGVRYMVQAGYDPAGMRGVMRILDEAAGDDLPPEFLSTHPHPETRKQTIRELLGGEYAYTQGNSEFGKSKERFERDAVPYFE